MEAALVAAARSGHGGASLEGLLTSPGATEALNKVPASGLTALHVSVWRNHLDLVSRLLALGADPNVADHESGWSSVHIALYWGNLQILAELLQQDGDLAMVDWKGRTPVDLVSAELKEYLRPGPGDVFSWGNGNNYTLGTGSTHVQLNPSRIESLHDAQAMLLSAAKFHSAAVSQDGKLYTWGWGRGGRLGHPEAHIHSGESAVIAPRLVSILGKRQVLAVAAAKHHTVFCTTAGEVYTMGSNRHGMLGYAVDTQPTPRRVAALRARVVAVAAANKHSVAVSTAGDVFTWGSNVLGQLGYGTSDSMSNASPRLVEAMKGKAVQQAAAAKRHTVVLTRDGEVYTWGHRGVSPRRVQLAGARDTLSASREQLRFHRGHKDVIRPLAVAVCAGAAHTSVLTRTGVVLAWRSADPVVAVHEVGGTLAGKRVVSISAGKYRTAAVSDEGDVYMWEGRSDYFPAEGRQPGSGSKKVRDKGRPIPTAGNLGHVSSSLGNGSPSPGEVGSYGSYSRKGSYFDRFARDREAAQPSGLSFTGRSDAARPASASKPSQADVFAKILPERVEGLKRAVSVAVGEKHSLALQRWAAAQLPGLPHVPWLAAQEPLHADAAAVAAAEEEAYNRAADSMATPRGSDAESDACGSDSMFSSPERASPLQRVPRREREPESVGVPSLQRICEEEVARQLVDPRTTLQVLEYADVAGADLLRAYCLAVAVCNLDAVLLEARGALEELPPHLLAEIERLWKLRLAGGSEPPSSATAEQHSAAAALAAAVAPEPAGTEDQPEAAAAQRDEAAVAAVSGVPARPVGSRLQLGARPTAAPPSLGSDEHMHTSSPEALQTSLGKLSLLTPDGQSSFKDKSVLDAEVAAQRLARALQKKLQQIESLEQRAAEGAQLDAQQQAKVGQRPVIRSALAALETGMAVEEVQIILKAAPGGKEEEEVQQAGGLQPSRKARAGEGGQGRQGSTLRAGKRGTPGKGGGPGGAAVAAQPAPDAEGSGLPAAASAEPAAALDAPGSSSGLAAPATARVAFDDGAPVLGTSPTATVPAFGPLGHAGAAPKSPGEPGTQVVGGFRGLDQSHPPSLQGPKSSGSKTKEKSRRTGGLSMFLRGDLERAATPPPASPSPAASPAAAWGAKTSATPTPTSLKEIFSQEAAAAGPSCSTKLPPAAGPNKGTPASAARTRPAAVEAPAPAQAPGAGGLRLSLANFMTTSPLAIQRSVAKSPPLPAWGASAAAGASPPAAVQSSFRTIQEEQQAAAASRSYGTSPSATHRPSAPTASLPPWRPPAMAAGAAASGAASIGAASSSLLGSSPTGTSLMGTSPSGRSFSAAHVPKHSKWYVPEERSIKSIKSIQTEETAVKELAKRYGASNVRIVPKERRAPGLPPPSAAKH